MTTTNGEIQMPPKEGKMKAMIVCWILGLGSLVAWNTISTIEDYYYYLFPKYHPSRVLVLVHQVFALIITTYLAYKESIINTRLRNILGYSFLTVSTSLLLVLDLATLGKGGFGAFIGTCAIVGSMGLSAHVQGGMLGDLSFMHHEFIQSFLAGSAAAGALTSVLRLITKAAFEKYKNGLRKGTMLFLAIATFLEFLSVLLYALYFPKLPIVKYYRSKAASEGSKTVASDLAAAGIYAQENQAGDHARHQRLSNKDLFLENIDYALDIFLIFVLTLSIFPGFIYENTGEHELGSWYPLVLVTCYNVSEMIASYVPLIKWFKIESRRGLMVAVLARFLMIPAFYFTAKYADQGWMIFLVSFLGATHGHLTVCVYSAAPKGYKGPEQNALGNMMVLFMFLGLVVGVALDWLWLIGKKNAF